MAIKILINGYYRSGTTMLFHQVNNALPVDSVGFYEPCYPLLGLVVRNEDSTKIQNLHGSTLWKSYQNLAEDVFEDLLRNHPNPDKKGIQNLHTDFAYKTNLKLLLDYWQMRVLPASSFQIWPLNPENYSTYF